MNMISMQSEVFIGSKKHTF